MSYRLVHLPSGVATVHAVEARETFHPVLGPATEASRLYVEQLKLVERIADCGHEFVLWDVGLGAAANPAMALDAAQKAPGRVHILSFDSTLAPLLFALEHAEALGYLAPFSAPLREAANHGVSNFRAGALEVRWEIHLGDFPALLESAEAKGWARPDAILYDPFSPAKNPAMWTLPLFRQLRTRAAEACSLATYSRSTLLRVTLLLAGFYVGAGFAIAEKEETTIAATQPGLIERPLGDAWLRRVRRSTSAAPLTGPVYRQAPLEESAWNALREHPQFAGLVKK